MKLGARLVEKPWGQTGVAHLPVGSCSTIRIGEVAFEHPSQEDLFVLVKFLYTSERLSIQVHPDNYQARSFGHASGKDEMWIVLDALPDARIGLGLKRHATELELRTAVLDGSIEDLMDWRPVKRGDVIYNKAGTIHAAGAGLVLLEVQQSVDLTYRLYDYGRPRELHLVEGLAVAKPAPHYDPRDCSLADGHSRILASGPFFGSAWCAGSLPAGVPLAADHYQLVVIEGSAYAAGAEVLPGECHLVTSLSDVQLRADCVAMIAWPVVEQLAEAA